MNKLCASSLKLLADYWTLRIIDALNERGELRYCELQRAIDNVNPVTLTNRLKKLEDAELIRRNEETRDKISVTYQLTDLGIEAMPVILAVNAFSARASKAGA